MNPAFNTSALPGAMIWDWMHFFKNFERLKRALSNARTDCKVYVYLLPCLICIAADLVLQVLSGSKEKHVIYARAISDNFSHGLVALVSWLLVINCRINFEQFCLTIVSFMTGSLIDLDHFYVAGSWRLMDALHLPRRPPLHSSSILLFIVPVILLYAYYRPKWTWLCDIPLVVFTAIFSHHLRDANRRGLWFHPFFITPPIPTPLYLALETMLPLFVRLLRIYISERKFELNTKTSTEL